MSSPLPGQYTLFPMSAPSSLMVVEGLHGSEFGDIGYNMDNEGREEGGGRADVERDVCRLTDERNITQY